MDNELSLVSTRRPRRLWRGVPELVLTAAFSAFVAWYVVTTRLPEEARELEARFGSERNSEGIEEWIIRDFFKDRRDGFFVDVGANHFKKHSNTYFLETALNWSGIAIEPLTAFAPEYQQFRPKTRFRPFFVSDVSNAEAKLYLLPSNHLVTSSDKSFNSRYGGGASEVTVPTITLNDLLDAEGVQSFDFMNMDIELSEPKALAGLDIRRFKPELVGIEAHPEVRQQIVDYFAINGYVVLGRYLRADHRNLWFTPLAHPSSH